MGGGGGGVTDHGLISETNFSITIALFVDCVRQKAELEILILSLDQ